MLGIGFLFVQTFLLNGSPPVLSRRTLIQNSIHASFTPCNFENYSSPILHTPEPSQESNSFNQIILNEEAKKIYFTGEVNDESCLAILQTLHTIQNQYSPSQIHHIDLIIQSKGGSLLPALGLTDWIINSDIPVYTWISGYAASAATLLSCVGAKRFMTKHSVILLHQLSMGIEHSKFEQIEDQYKNGAIFMQLIKNIYLEHSKMKPQELDDILSHDYWLNSSQAKNLGLVDIII